MKLTLDIDPEQHPNQVGEILRAMFFDHEKHCARKRDACCLGCYSSFELRPDVEQLPSKPVKDEDGMSWTRAQKNGIIMAYYWDGDGTLMFHLDNGYLINNDCKKDYNWEFVEG